MKIVVTGSSGLIGSALVPALRADGHEVIKLVRRPPAQADEAHWDPAHRTIDDGALAGADAVVHLAGVGVGDKRWNDAHKQAVLASRVDGTTTIADALAELDRPAVLISASAVGYYGDRGDEVLDESAAAGTGFLADLVQQWEAATKPAADSGVRVVTIRTGLVLAAGGGLLGRTLPIFKAGLGGRLGSGRQWMPWIALADEIGAIRFLLASDDLHGAVNLSAPEPVRNTEFTKALGRAVHRPAIAVVPRVALRLALGEFADEGALVSQRAVPARLLDAGFAFSYADLDATLRSIV